MKTTLVVLGVLAAGVSFAQAQSLPLEAPNVSRDRALIRLRSDAPGELGALSQSQRRRWQEQAAQLLANRFPSASRGVRVEVTPLGIVRLTGRAPDMATKLAMARAIMDRSDIGLMVDNALAPFEGEQAAALE